MGIAIEEFIVTEEDTDSESELVCDELNPGLIIVPNVDRRLQGEWKCAGENTAGLGGNSSPEYLSVLYPPGGATIVGQNTSWEKYENNVLFCEVPELGNPTSTSFIWKRNGEVLEGAHENTFMLENLSVKDRGTYNCQAENEIGFGDPGEFLLDIEVPPTFLKTLEENMVFVDSQPQPVECQVECFINQEECNLEWSLNNKIIDIEDSKYTIHTERFVANEEDNKFESISSRLSWNMDQFPEKKISHEHSNFTLSCYITDADSHHLSSSQSLISIEYAPEFVKASHALLEIEEGTFGPSIICESKAIPEPAISWFLNDEVISDSGVLSFEEPIERHQEGIYICKAENEHGYKKTEVSLNVIYKPKCFLNYEIIGEDDTLVIVCSAEANPKEDLLFWWSRDDTVTFEGQASDIQSQSKISLNLGNQTHGNYSCHVSNSVGESEPCSLEITDNFIEKVGQENRLFLIIIIIAAVIGVLFITSVIAGIIYFKSKSQPKGTSEPSDCLLSSREDLPFSNLKRPPEQVLSPSQYDDLDYADARFKKGLGIVNMFKRK